MAMVIRDVREHELDSVLALNNAAGAGILPIDADRLSFFWKHAAYFRVAETNGHLAGFLIALTPDVHYDSPNFLWFRERYSEFVYIDRIVIAGAHRGAGLGRIFYADLQSFAEVRSPLIACEVFVTSGRDPALLFHGSFGFHEVGQQVVPSIALRASYLVKELCSWPWVRSTYLNNGKGGLPALEWLSARATAAYMETDRVVLDPSDHAPQRATG
ncbi:MAG TPA: GNAT family N-acetyltransferase [Xanthomonadaceae bacterium]|nr:GNAT family N-acetyltransferase [Xanthomonadaceae bacterium]